jgi:tubulin polyglutamylase TTLL9
MSELFVKLVPEDRRRAVRVRTQFSNCVAKAIRRRGWVLDGENWDIFWAEKEDIPRLFESFKMTQAQRVNHHRNFYEICHKDNLHHNLQKHRKFIEKSVSKAESLKYHNYPLSFILPSEYPLFLDAFKRSGDPNIWIMKPACRSQGKGIFLVRSLAQVSAWESGKQA